MPSFGFAEWILSLIMPRESAAAAMGDLVESASGPVDLWVSVVRTFFGSLYRQLAPALMPIVAKDFVLTAAGLSARYARDFLLPVVLLYLVIDTWPQSAPVGTLVAGFFGILLSLAITLVVPWKTGRAVAERHPGKEMPAFVAICAAALALGAISWAMGRPWNSILAEEPWVLLRWHQIPTPWNPILMLISMILARRRWLRTEGVPA